MPAAAHSTVNRYRPAILVCAGAAAAYAAFLIYSSVQAPPSLHRSNAVRRPRAQTGRAPLSGIRQQIGALGEIEFFGHMIELDASNLANLSPARLRQLAGPVDDAIYAEQLKELYFTLFTRVLGTLYPNGPLSTAEAQAMLNWLGIATSREILREAIRRHAQAFPGQAPPLLPNDDDHESIAPTEVSMDDYMDVAGYGGDGQTLQRTLYHIAEDRARHEGVVHRGITCNGCDTKPIRGIRWRCANCADFDLCSDCENTNSHYKHHIFYKVRVPAPYLSVQKQEPVYPGRPHLMHPSIPSSLRRTLTSATRMEAEEIEALWDQFTCLATMEWDSDPSKVGWAMDRRAFNHAFIPRYSKFVAAPNLIYDRIFAYYDTDNNGMIGFEEFVRGLDGIYSRDSTVKHRIIFDGYDIDGDGFISRKDILRIFRAYFAIQDEATKNYLIETTEELTVRGALETIRSSQPLGSAFTQGAIIGDHAGTVLRLHEKFRNDDLITGPTVANDSTDTLDRADVLRRTSAGHLENNGRVAAQGDLKERWRRRDFYVDEEEGLERPEDAEVSDTEESHAGAVTPSRERSRGSRASSRVRFEDDVDFETRSNASTSSRPVGERWGGYEVPEPEKDLGRDVFYQITQQAFNELLDPLFQHKEDLAMDVCATRAERRKHAILLEEIAEDFNCHDHMVMNKNAAYLGPYAYSKWIVSIIAGYIKLDEVFLNHDEAASLVNVSKSTAEEIIEKIIAKVDKTCSGHTQLWREDFAPTALQLWSAELWRRQLRSEISSTFFGLLARRGWITDMAASDMPALNMSTQNSRDHAVWEWDSTGSNEPHLNQIARPYQDPTMPQFRPNSDADVLLAGTPPVSPLFEPENSSPSIPQSSAPFFHPAEDDHRLPTEPYFVRLMVQSSATSSTTASPPFPNPPSHEDTLGHFNPFTTANIEDENSLPPLPAPEVVYEGAIQLMIDESEPRLRYYNPSYVGSTEQELAVARENLDSALRRDAASPFCELHHAYLAMLNAVDTETGERGGPGRVDFKEFVERVRSGEMRFLESWMETVSF